MGVLFLFCLIAYSFLKADVQIRWQPRIHAIAEIEKVDKSTARPQRISTHHFYYAFGWQNKTYRGVISRTAFFHHTPYKMGDSVEVMFLGSDPEQVIIANDYTNLFWGFL